MNDKFENEETLFNQILTLINSGMHTKALSIKNELKQAQQQRFEHYYIVHILHRESSMFRGVIINDCVMLEMLLSKILSSYFTTDETKRKELNCLVFDRMNLKTKYNNFKKLIKQRYPEVWKKYQDELKNIEELIDYRNELTHSLLDSSQVGISKLRELALDVKSKKRPHETTPEIRIMYYDNFKLESKTITREIIDKYHERILKSTISLENCARDVILDYD